MRRVIKILLVFVLLPLAVIGGCATVIVVKARPKPKPPRTAKVARGEVVVAVRETGTVTPIKQVEVKSKVTGQLAVLAVEEGDRVTKGQLIARLDVPDLEAQRDQIRAQITAAQARLEQARLTAARDAELTDSQIAQAQASLRTAQSAVKECEARRLDAVRDYENKRRLMELGGYIAQNDVDVAKSAVGSAVQAKQTAEERVREQEVAVRIAQQRRAEAAMSKSGVAQAAASLQQVRDQLTELETRLHDAVITAPCGGVVISRAVREGELMTAVSYYGSGAPIVVIGDLSTMLVKVNLNEVDISKVHLGQRVKVTADALRDRTFTGRVTRIAPASAAADPRQAGTSQNIVRFPVEITVTGSAVGLKPGMTADIEIQCQCAPRALWVPNDALFEKRGKWYVSVYSGMKNGKAQTKERAVVKGLANDARTEVRSGVKEGEQVELGKSGIPPRKMIDLNGHGGGG